MNQPEKEKKKRKTASYHLENKRALVSEADLPDVSIQPAVDAGLDNQAVQIKGATPKTGQLEVCGGTAWGANHQGVVAEWRLCCFDPWPSGVHSTLGAAEPLYAGVHRGLMQ
jgi:hypothetical protein